MDWKVKAAAPLVIESQLPIKGTYLIWETPKVSLIHNAHKDCCMCKLAVFFVRTKESVCSRVPYLNHLQRYVAWIGITA